MIIHSPYMIVNGPCMLIYASRMIIVCVDHHLHGREGENATMELMMLLHTMMMTRQYTMTYVYTCCYSPIKQITRVTLTSKTLYGQSVKQDVLHFRQAIRTCVKELVEDRIGHPDQQCDQLARRFARKKQSCALRYLQHA